MPCDVVFLAGDVASLTAGEGMRFAMETGTFYTLDDVIKPCFGNHDIIILLSVWLA